MTYYLKPLHSAAVEVKSFNDLNTKLNHEAKSLGEEGTNFEVQGEKKGEDVYLFLKNTETGRFNPFKNAHRNVAKEAVKALINEYQGNNSLHGRQIADNVIVANPGQLHLGSINAASHYLKNSPNENVDMNPPGFRDTLRAINGQGNNIKRRVATASTGTHYNKEKPDAFVAHITNELEKISNQYCLNNIETQELRGYRKEVKEKNKDITSDFTYHFRGNDSSTTSLSPGRKKHQEQTKKATTEIIRLVLGAEPKEANSILEEISSEKQTEVVTFGVLKEIYNRAKKPS